MSDYNHIAPPHGNDESETTGLNPTSVQAADMAVKEAALDIMR